MPILIIDGREIDWDEYGRMLMSCEGWQFKLSIADKSEELPKISRLFLIPKPFLHRQKMLVLQEHC